MPRKKKSQILTPLTDSKRGSKKEGGVIVLEGFQYSTIFRREVLATNPDFIHRLVLSPSYLFKSVDGSYITDMGDTAYPLLTPLNRGEISLTSGDGYSVFFLKPSIINDERVFYVVTQNGYVRAVKMSGVARNLGKPISNFNRPYETTLILYTDKIFFINSQSTSIYHIPETTTGTSWTSIGGFNSPYVAETFSIYLYIVDKNASADLNRRIVRVYNTGLTQSGTLDLGTNWDIQDIVNNNNRFLVIIANPFGITSNQYAFLWDGSYQNRYFHAFNLPGRYVGSVNYLGAFLMFIQVGGALNIYELSGYSLRLIETMPGIVVNTTALPRQRFSTYGNYIIFPAKIKDLGLNGLVVYNILEKELVFLNGNTSNEIVAALATNDLSGNIRVFYADQTADKVKYLTLLPAGSFDDYLQTSNPLALLNNEIIYISNPVNFLRVSKIDKIEIYYGSKPSSASSFTLEIIARNRKTGETQTVSKTINNTFPDNYVLLDEVGVVGDEMTFVIKATNTGAFKANIKRVLIYYTHLT